MEEACREAYAVLSQIPVESLAANGESGRGKISRMLCFFVNVKCLKGDIGEWFNDLDNWHKMVRCNGLRHCVEATC